ncbi:helix-turn-helix domain-containing protein [Lacrimispora indolis]|uniref:helix-turn-helix domain-containing protein n=1 Tax=Lacrimispora indolis TaxID=69825 RepID=UPI000427E957|nr:helix-turn-helix transcriptional regulator [[Clostridium] methoxybenzovorans]
MYQKYVELRNAKGVTDYRVAIDTRITKSTFTDWKNGRSKPKFEKLMVLAKYFDVPVEFFADKD